MIAARLVCHPEAFSIAPSKGRRRPRKAAAAHLAWLRTLPCVITGKRTNVQAAHIRFQDYRAGKHQAGIGAKPDDCFAVPLCSAKHDEQHRGSERKFWERHGIDPIFVALALWAASGDDDRGEAIVRNARMGLTRQAQRGVA
jgi:hypothetical protein